MVMTACSSVDVSPAKEDTMNDLSPQTIALDQTDYITENEMLESNEDIKLVSSENNENVTTQSSHINSSQTEEKDIKTTYLSQEPMESLTEETHTEDSIIIGDTEYINLMHEEKFEDWISVAEKYGAELYAIPYSDVFAIVKDEEVLVGIVLGLPALHQTI